MYKVICLDLDGTLLNSNKEISNYNLKVLEKLYYNGKQIIVATGRGLSKTIELTKKLSFPFTIIANNGAIAQSSYSKEIIYCNTLDYRLYRDILKISENHKISPYLHIYDSCSKKSLIIPNHKKKEDHLGSVRIIDEIIHKDEATEEDLNNILSVVYLDEEEKINKLNKDILNLNLKISSHTLTSIRENILMAEYLNPIAQKSIGIHSYLIHEKISWKEVISFGDDNNDIEMIRTSGIGVCMKNGSDLLKVNSSYISNYTNDEDGVAKELSKIFGGLNE